MRELYLRINRIVGEVFTHDMFNVAKAAAYSAMLTLFPAILVITTLLSQVHEGTTMMGDLRAIFEQLLPVDTMNLLQSAVLAHRVNSLPVIMSATSLSIFAGLGMTLSLMEGFRRAYRVPLEETWGFWGRRVRAFMLVPIIMIPLSVATLVIVFGHQIEQWMVEAAGHDLRHIVLFFWRMVRWSIAIVASMAVLTVLYHYGTRRVERWRAVVPGAVTGTLLWFPATLAFGWYVTRDENYSRFYGSFAAGIATLVWLYLTAFSVLVGAEVNGWLYWSRRERNGAPNT
ncbi:MAG TPA: YihY/virulence factor BrkB family protein [Terracidiphilus sp.]|nr:YihY/virulence factor BrkB family protein [Terracidiphilus sp.]